jgi:hypothetical protein
MSELLERSYRWLHGAAAVPLERYYSSLPTMPHGETAAELASGGFPRAGDLLDGLLIGAAMTLARGLLSRFVFTPLGRRAMKHRYYGFRRVPILDEALR